MALPITSLFGNGQALFNGFSQGSLPGAFPNQYLGPGFTFGVPQSSMNLGLLFATAGTTAPNLEYQPGQDFFPPFLTSNITGIDFFNRAVTNPMFGFGGGFGGGFAPQQQPFGAGFGGFGGGFPGFV